MNKLTALLLVVCLITVAGVAAEDLTIFYNMNGYQVYNGECTPPAFILTETTHIGSIQNYHYNNGAGVPAGTIGLRDQNNVLYGPWPAPSTSGGLFLTANPDVNLPPGTYTIVDSDQSTWSYNSESGNECFSGVYGYAIPNGGGDVPEFGLIALGIVAIASVLVIGFNRKK